MLENIGKRTNAEIAAYAAEIATTLISLTDADADRVLAIVNVLRSEPASTAPPTQAPEKPPVFSIPRSGRVA